MNNQNPQGMVINLINSRPHYSRGVDEDKRAWLESMLRNASTEAEREVFRKKLMEMDSMR